MSLFSWMSAKFGRGSRADPVARALEATEDAVDTARELRQTMEPYAKMDDPFISLWTNRYEVEQERRIYMGPEK